MLLRGFTFSQSSLQDYADCARRFQLRYVQNVRWPMPQTAQRDDHEDAARQGSVFHQLVQQHTLGLPEQVLDALAAEGYLRRWWQVYRAALPELPPVRHAEVRLVVPLGPLLDEACKPQHYRLAAQYDLLAVELGQRAMIVDWKTGSTRLSHSWLEQRWQTLVYRYVLVEAGREINGGAPFRPEQVEMAYWLVNFAGQVERFPYDEAQHRAAAQTLTATLNEMLSRREDIWPLVADLKRCQFCAYRTLCARPELSDVSDGASSEADDVETMSFDFDLDIEQIAEIAF